MEDIALLKQYAANHDANAFAELVRRYAGLVYSACLRIARNSHDAEDIAQECFLELARNAGSITTSLPGWLHELARRRTIDYVRSASARTRYEDKAMLETQKNKNPTWEEIAPHIDDALVSIPEKFRTPIILHYLSGVSQEDIARDLNMSQGTVSRQLEKGIEYLRVALKKAGVISSVTFLTALIAENAFCSAPATLMTALGKMAIAGIGASGVAGTAATVGGITGAASGGGAVSSGGITTFITAAKTKIMVMLTASVLIIGGITIMKNKKTESLKPQSDQHMIEPIEKTHKEEREKSTSKPFTEILKTNVIIEKRFKGTKVWVPGMEPVFTQESSDGQYLAKYVNKKIILLDWLNPEANPKYGGVTLRWLFFYDKKGRIDKVLLQTVPKFDNGKKHTKILYTVNQRDSGGNPVAIDGIVFAPDWTVAFVAELRCNPQGLLDGYLLYNKPETVRYEYKFEYDSNGNCIKAGHNLTTGEWYSYVPVDWEYFQIALGIVEFFINMNGRETYKNRVLGFN